MSEQKRSQRFFRLISLIIFIIFVFTHEAIAQSLDVRPFNPEIDPDIDMYINNWRNSQPRKTHGGLIERDVLYKGNPEKPTRQGAVLKYVNRFTHASLYPRASTQPVTLSGEQEIFYVISGNGTITSGDRTAELYSGIFVLIPDRCSFTMTNTGDDFLNMYLIVEPVVRGDFILEKEMIVVDENTLPILTTTGHWSMIIKQAFNIKKELSIIEYVNAITFDPMTIGQPHSHNVGCEEVWTCIEGETLLFLGKQLRMQTPGTAYMIPIDGNTPHSNINHTDKPVKLLYFSVFKYLEEKDGIKRSKE